MCLFHWDYTAQAILCDFIAADSTGATSVASHTVKVVGEAMNDTLTACPIDGEANKWLVMICSASNKTGSLFVASWDGASFTTGTAVDAYTSSNNSVRKCSLASLQNGYYTAGRYGSYQTGFAAFSVSGMTVTRDVDELAWTGGNYLSAQICVAPGVMATCVSSGSSAKLYINTYSGGTAVTTASVTIASNGPPNRPTSSTIGDIDFTYDASTGQFCVASYYNINNTTIVQMAVTVWDGATTFTTPVYRRIKTGAANNPYKIYQVASPRVTSVGNGYFLFTHGNADNVVREHYHGFVKYDAAAATLEVHKPWWSASLAGGSTGHNTSGSDPGAATPGYKLNEKSVLFAFRDPLDTKLYSFVINY